MSCSICRRPYSMRWHRILSLSVLLILLGKGNYPVEDKISLNGTWLFKYDPRRIGEQAGYFLQDYSRQDWQRVDVPSFWDDPRYDGLGWYYRTFTVPTSLRNKPLALYFEAIDDNAVIYLNNQKVYEHQGANIDFYVVVTSHIKTDMPNALVVRIDDTGGAGGINGKVWLRSFTTEEELLQTEYHRRNALPAPKWLDEAVIYEIFPRVFSPAGNLAGVQQALPYFTELGVNCLWLMPIFPIGKERRKGTLGSPYATADYFAVAPELGTKDDLKRLVKAAHQRDIRVILDIACNHCAWDNRLLEEHPDYFTMDANGQIVPPNADWTDVADFNYDNPALRDYMWSVLEYWVRECDIDGYRMDVAELVPNDFWEEALRRLQRIKPDVLMLAEGENPRLHLKGFHLTYAWNVRRTLYRIIKEQAPAEDLYETLKRESYRYPQSTRRMRFIENHDEERARQFFGASQAQVTAVVAFTLPGVPMLYAGQEWGASERPSLFERNSLPWPEKDEATFTFYRSLLQLRRDYPALRTGRFVPLANTQADKILTYGRQTANEYIVIIANLSAQSVKAEIKLAEPAAVLQPLWGTVKIEKTAPHVISCQPWQWGIFKLISDAKECNAH